MRGDKQVFPHTASSPPILGQMLSLYTFPRLNLAFVYAVFYNGEKLTELLSQYNDLI